MYGTLAFINNIEVSTSTVFIASVSNPMRTFKTNITVKDANKVTNTISAQLF